MISTPYGRGQADILASAIQSQQNMLASHLARITHQPEAACKSQLHRMSTAYLMVAGTDVLIHTNDN